jgi:hypothetical protein
MPNILANPPTLAETQTTLWQLITAPENITEAPSFVEGDEELPAVERVNIYANMYFFRIRDALKEDFPSIVEALGEDGFHNLIAEYLQVYPPTHYSLRNAGRHLAEFISDEKLSELARFEWALIEAFDAADAPLLTEDDLKKVPAEDWPGLVLKLHPSVQLVAHDHHIVWRQGLEVVHRVADEAEWRLLVQIHSGCEFAALCEEVSSETILSYLQTWISQGLLAKS